MMAIGKASAVQPDGVESGHTGLERREKFVSATWMHVMLSRALLSASLVAAPLLAQAQETVCARVKIEIKQELTLERQAFDATMKINNTTDTGVIENVSVVVKV